MSEVSWYTLSAISSGYYVISCTSTNNRKGNDSSLHGTLFGILDPGGSTLSSPAGNIIDKTKQNKPKYQCFFKTTIHFSLLDGIELYLQRQQYRRHIIRRNHSQQFTNFYSEDIILCSILDIYFEGSSACLTNKALCFLLDWTIKGRRYFLLLQKYYFSKSYRDINK